MWRHILRTVYTRTVREDAHWPAFHFFRVIIINNQRPAAAPPCGKRNRPSTRRASTRRIDRDLLDAITTTIRRRLDAVVCDFSLGAGRLSGCPGRHARLALRGLLQDAQLGGAAAVVLGARVPPALLRLGQLDGGARGPQVAGPAGRWRTHAAAAAAAREPEREREGRGSCCPLAVGLGPARREPLLRAPQARSK